MQLLESYHVKWDRKSRNSSESMPLGGGDIGMNVWVEGSDLLFYLSRSGTVDENGQMLKLGRVRLSIEPNLFADGCEFTQELILAQGFIEIKAKHAEYGNVCIKLWVEVDQPIVHVDVDASVPLTVSAIYESWRTADREVADRHACTTLMGYPGEVVTTADHISFYRSGVLFYHRNKAEHMKFEVEVRNQQLEAYQDEIYHPTNHLIFGGLMMAEGMQKASIMNGEYLGVPYQGWVLKSELPSDTHRIRILLHSAQMREEAEWIEQLDRQAKDGMNTAAAWKIHQAWWHTFWSRSHIALRPGQADPQDPVWQVGRNYQLFRYMLGCNAIGIEPTKFNGGLFTFDPMFVIEQYESQTPDFRRWGGGSFTAQNQRLVYWPMLASGDFTAMLPQFEFYRRALPTAELRSRVYWGHEGCSFTEQINHTGLPTGREYGWNRAPGLDPGVEDNNWVNYEYVHQLDFALMILEYYRYSGQDIAAYMPFVTSAVKFFDEHYQFRCRQLTGAPLDENGFLSIYPSTALETFKDARNPADVIAGLTAVLQALLDLPQELAGEEQKAEWLDMLNRVPPIPFEMKEGRRTIAPAETWSRVQNVEIPQLYPLFPFGVYGLGRPDLQTAQNTWRHSIYHNDHRNHISWHQGNIFTARLGLADEAGEFAVKKLADGPYRFPAFWGPGRDWTPDHNWGGSGMIGLQDMLLQTNGKAIYLLPAWPDEWDVDFKLHAPYETVIEGRYINGKLESLRVTPESRRSDIINMK